MDYRDLIRAKTPSCTCRYPRILRIAMGDVEKTYRLKKKPTEAELDAILADSGVEEYQGTAEVRCPKE